MNKLEATVMGERSWMKGKLGLSVCSVCLSCTCIGRRCHLPLPEKSALRYSKGDGRCCPGVVLQQNTFVVLVFYVVSFACLCLDTWEVPFEEISELQWLGSGAQGAVFLGKFRAEEVAIKKVRDQNETDIKHLRKLKHPNIIAFK